MKYNNGNSINISDINGVRTLTDRKNIFLNEYVMN